MDNFQYDQAEGLRRMLAGSRPRIYTFLSATQGDEKSAVLANLGASLARAGSNVVVLDASMSSNGVSERFGVRLETTLLQVARGERELNEAILSMPQGFGLAALATCNLRQALRHQTQLQRVVKVFDSLAKQADVLLVDAEPDVDGALPLQALAEGEIVVLVSDNATSIKAAYSMIKRLNEHAGRRGVGILVTGATEQRAQVVFQNMAKAAARYLAVSLNSIGFVPQDEHVAKANRIGRSVVDAFPLARVSVAFRKMAEYFICGSSHADIGLSVRSSNIYV